MLGSWFSQKASDDGTIDGTTPRPSFASPTDPQSPPRQSTDGKPPKRAFPTAYTTPHDTVLSELQGASSSRLNAPDVSHRPASSRSEQAVSHDLQESVQNPARSEGNLLAPTPTAALQASSHASPASAGDILLDPFDGMNLGVLIPRHGSADNVGELSPSPFNLPSTFDGNPINSNNVGNEAVWNHLSRILDLQSQISTKHLEMENIGTAKGGDTKRKGHKLGSKSVAESLKPASGASSGLGMEDPPAPPGLPRPRQWTMSTVSVESSTDEQDHEEGVNVPSEEAEKVRIREDEFAKLATQFEGRKEAINDIMSKLDDLSKALSKLHDLPSPNIDFSAPRQSSSGVTSPPITTSPKGPSNGDTKAARPSSQSTSPDLNQEYDWSRQNAPSSSSTFQPPVASGSRIKNEPITVKPAPQKATSLQKRIVPTVLVNSKDPQPSVHESPASIESLKLSRE